MTMLAPVVSFNSAFIRVNFFGIIKYTLKGLNFQIFIFYIILFKECKLIF